VPFSRAGFDGGYRGIAEALHRQGRSADAVIFLGAFKSLFTIPESYYNLARYLCANGQGGDAREMLRFAIEGDEKLRKRAIYNPELSGLAPLHLPSYLDVWPPMHTTTTAKRLRYSSWCLFLADSLSCGDTRSNIQLVPIPLLNASG
jgi:hypothetical protein